MAVDGGDLPERCAPEITTDAAHAQAIGDGQQHVLSGRKSDGLVTGSPTGPLVTSRKPNLAKVRGKREAERAKRATNRQVKKQQRSKAATRAPSEALTFAPADAERDRMIKVLGYKARNRDRMKLEKGLTREFLRIYLRRRHEVHTKYVMVPKERPYAAEAARLCIIKAVTPTQLIDYWMENIGNFTGMRFPPLNFLARPGNVDEVSIQVAIKPGKKRKRRGSDGPEVHAYSGALDPGLRRGLVAAGIIDGTEFSDRFLMTVQTTAQSLARGRNLFVSAKLKPMVDWAVENLYAD